MQYCIGGNGAGVVVEGGELDIVDCVFENNRASAANANGGALFAHGGARVLIQDCDFNLNSADKFGGAIYLKDIGTNSEISNCSFALHTASSGGAVYVEDGAFCIIEDSEFSENLVSFDGGAVSITGSGSSFSYCCFKENNAGSFGGGIDNQAGADTLLTQNLFANNASSFGGGGIYSLNSNPIIFKCTFANNISHEENGGAIHNDGTSFPSIEGTLFCGNIGNAAEVSTLEGHIFPTVADADYEFVGGNEFHALCSTCQGDVNGDGVLDLTDLVGIAIVMTWGECNGCLEDLDGNGVVDPDDILAFVELLSARLDFPCTIECPYR